MDIDADAGEGCLLDAEVAKILGPQPGEDSLASLLRIIDDEISNFRSSVTNAVACELLGRDVSAFAFAPAQGSSSRGAWAQGGGRTAGAESHTEVKTISLGPFRRAQTAKTLPAKISSDVSKAVSIPSSRRDSTQSRAESPLRQAWPQVDSLGPSRRDSGASKAWDSIVPSRRDSNASQHNVFGDSIAPSRRDSATSNGGWAISVAALRRDSGASNASMSSRTSLLSVPENARFKKPKIDFTVLAPPPASPVNGEVTPRGSAVSGFAADAASSGTHASEKCAKQGLGSRQNSVAFNQDCDLCSEYSRASERSARSWLEGKKDQVMEVLDVWNRKLFSQRTSRMNTSTFSDISDFAVENDVGAWRSSLARLMMQPGSVPHLIIESCAFVAILIELVVIPLKLVDPPSSAVFNVGSVFSWALRILWTLKLIVSFFVGYVNSRGDVIMDPGDVSLRYVRTWFMLDLSACSMDWLELYVTGSVQNIVSSLRLLRLARLVWTLTSREGLFAFFAEHTRSERLALIASLLRLVGCMAAITHLFACAWYGLATTTPGGSPLMKELRDANYIDRYIACFHYAFSLFIGAAIVIPEALGERSLIIAMMYVSFMFSAYLVSSMTSAMTQLQLIASQRSKQLSALSHYLSDHKISAALAVKVRQNAEHMADKLRNHMPESSVELLSLISERLRQEIHFEIYGNTLFNHNLFSCYNDVNPEGIRKICHNAVDIAAVSFEDLIFANGELGTYMYFSVSGRLSYMQGRTEVQEPVEVGMWLSEAVLWTSWSHCGTLQARDDADILQMHATTFQTIMSKYPSHHMKAYAHHFVALLKTIPSHQLSDMPLGARGDVLVGTAFADHSAEEEDDNEKRRSSVSSSPSIQGLFAGFKRVVGKRNSTDIMKKSGSMESMPEE
eukprot:TRINITY_DN11861_c0_g1_i1.p1 TRINITY_DN11861_c0_g1~~TRINITY_DN11861_c0_g1_i1.p1  ORF type:complete len:902 (+),score=131.64 TRINITY_DN11861_c0_g1_i1:112-2817(+)